MDLFATCWEGAERAAELKTAKEVRTTIARPSEASDQPYRERSEATLPLTQAKRAVDLTASEAKRPHPSREPTASEATEAKHPSPSHASEASGGSNRERSEATPPFSLPLERSERWT